MRVIATERKQYNKLRYDRYQRKTIIKDTIAGWAFVSPVVLSALAFSLSALIFAFTLTLFKGKVTDLHWVGFKNWESLGDPNLELGPAFNNTLLYTATAVPISLILTVVTAAVIRSKFISKKKLVLAIFFLPTVTSAIASTIIFKQLISPDGLFKVDYMSPGQEHKVMWVVIVSATWGATAGQLIGMNAAFSTIEETQYEAADMDGASGVRKFFSITVPSIGPILSFSLFIGLAGGIGVFGGPYLLAQGMGLPKDALMTVVLKGYLYIVPSDDSSIVDIGLGTTILFMVGLVMLGVSMVTNVFFPINKRTQ